jgi:lipopolysaccharide transport system permease protein
MAWSLFTEIITRSLMVFIDNGDLMKKVNFPKVTLPLIVLGSALVNNLLLLLAAQGIFGLLGHYPSWEMLWLPVLMLITAVFALGIGLIAGTLNVFMRDLGEAVPVVLQVAFWLTPIVYPLSIIPADRRHWLDLNPMFPVVDAYHQILAFQEPPELLGLGMVAGGAVVLLMVSLVVVRRASGEIVDIL